LAEIVPVVSEALEAQVRSLLPSQRGFGEDLQASNVIMPIIDLTAAAEGSGVPVFLQQAQAFGSQTAFSATNTTVTVANSPGFYRITATSGCFAANGTTVTNSIDITDGISTKRLFQHTVGGAGGQQGTSVPIDYVVFLTAGDSVSVTSSATSSYIVGSSRQIADVNGNLVNPIGFTPQ
jgi:hypothetical protein